MNAADNAFEVIFPGLVDTDWQIPAYLALFILSIMLGITTWRRSWKEPFMVTAVN